MRYLILQEQTGLRFVAMPESHMYQLVALLKRLQKEIDKLTIAERPQLPTVIAECAELELLSDAFQTEDGLAYVNAAGEPFLLFAGNGLSADLVVDGDSRFAGTA